MYTQIHSRCYWMKKISLLTRLSDGRDIYFYFSFLQRLVSDSSLFIFFFTFWENIYCPKTKALLNKNPKTKQSKKKQKNFGPWTKTHWRRVFCVQFKQNIFSTWFPIMSRHSASKFQTTIIYTTPKIKDSKHEKRKKQNTFSTVNSEKFAWIQIRKFLRFIIE